MASSSSTPGNNKHDVFLSFRGEDTRDNFTSLLHYVLSLKNIKTFIDNDLKRGDNISQSILDTIEASSISIIIFSERYASSEWCLDELLQILNCMHNHGQIVMPVFYDVDPSHVQSPGPDCSFGKHFSGLQERYPDKMERWKKALTEAANLSGFDSNVIKRESELIKEIADKVLKRLEETFQSENKDLVGIEGLIKEIESLLRTDSAGVCKLGIWGIGGIGKTTISCAVFNRISRHFEGSFFAHNVREAEETSRIKDLQKELLSKLLDDGNVRNVEFQLNRLAGMKVLIVFDDVSQQRQIESLIGCLDKLGSGSRVIITTRDKQVLLNCWVKQIHQMKELEHDDAHKLFCQRAFGRDHPDARYTELTQKAMEYAKGVPLALTVLGCYLCGMSKEQWESAMRKLETDPHDQIQEVLKVSYDGLDYSQKNVFLHIACFFEGANRDEVISILNASGFQAEIELSVLERKSLITSTLDFFGERIRMHDLLRDMGRAIVREESIDHPGKRSRLWGHNDICEVLKKNSGTEAVKGISLNMNKVNREIHINPDTFARMPELRFLKFYGENKCMVSHLEGVPFAELRYFEWTQCPLKTLNVRAENLVSINMPGSKVEQLWDDVQNLVNLKEIDLSKSVSLMKLPDFSLAQNLEILNLDGCLSLTETHSSIQYLNKLETLDLENCKSLRNLPTSIDSKYLKVLKLSGCLKLKNFPEISSSHIYYLDLIQVGIEELPSSIHCLSNLKELFIENCSRLKNISSSIFKLKSLKFFGISYCSNLEGFLEISSCNIDGSTGIEQLALSNLSLVNCPNLQSLPSSLCMLKSLKSLEIIDCKKLERLPDQLGNLEALEELQVEGTAIREVSESLGQLSSLQRMILSDNRNLQRIPESIKYLSKLICLKIRDCERLQTLPELPRNLDFLDASGCTSLEALSAGLSSISNNLYAHLYNCLKLDPNELSEIVGDFWREQLFHGERGIMKSMYFPGNEIPKWFRHQSMGSSVKTLSPPGVRSEFIGFAFCTVVAFPVPEHHHNWIYVNDNRSHLEINLVCLGSKFRSCNLGRIRNIESDHVFLGSYLINEGYGEEIDPSYGEVSFCFRHSYYDFVRCEVKKCGIHFAYAQDV